MIAATICTGTCGRPMRSQAVRVADAPGTQVSVSSGMCMTCYRHSRGKSMKRIDETRRRGDVRAITTAVNVSPETLATARAKVTRWFPGDTELLKIIGLAS